MEYPYGRYKVIPLDRQKMIGHFAPGIEIPLKPFFGSMGVAPAGGKIDTAPPFAHAGNLDNKELVAGTTLYIPVAAKGALFQAGDGHAAQGNGEVDITALETYLSAASASWCTRTATWSGRARKRRPTTSRWAFRRT
jgi:acetamidase/formamidase